MKKIIKANLLNIIFLVYLEFLFMLLTLNTYKIDMIITRIIYIIFLSFAITLITTTKKEKVNKIINLTIYFFICLWFALQFTFTSSMKTFFSLPLFNLTGQAVSFIGETLKLITTYSWGIVLFYLPFIFLIIFNKKINYEFTNKKHIYYYIIMVIVGYLSFDLYISKDKDNTLSSSNLYHNIDNTPLSINNLGVLPTFFSDINKIILNNKNEIYSSKEKESINENKNILYLDLSNENLDKNIKNYIEKNPGTNKNKYTGYLENKNLIFIVAESFDEIAVSENLTPTLYKLTNNGFTFNNYYVPYYLSTIGGEFQSLTGLYPSNNTLIKWKEGTNSFPYGIANEFKEKGYNTYAYHDHDGYFQDRNKYLNSIGFDNFKACNKELDINCNVFPESDIEMIDKTYSEYMTSDKPFITYYMTVSGHMDYNFKDNYISNKNKSLVDNLPYSEEEKAYLATQIELDKALELLIQKLEENNKIDDTVIVLTADHYPYALSHDSINKLSSHKKDNIFEINHNSLIIWNNNIQKEEINKVGMPVDIIPTIYNLFGINYDSRLFIGNDLLSDSEGLVILNNLSWITDKGKYNSITNTFTGEEDSNYVDKINKNIQDKLNYSKDIIKNDGYKYITVK